MFKKVLFSLFVILLVGCQMTPEQTTGGSEQACPAWTGYNSGQKCIVKQWKAFIRENAAVNMSEWDQLRFTTLKDVIIDHTDNIIVNTDRGDIVNTDLDRLLPGSYVASKVDPSTSAEFSIVNPSSSDGKVSISGEYIQLVEE